MFPEQKPRVKTSLAQSSVGRAVSHRHTDVNWRLSQDLKTSEVWNKNTSVGRPSAETLFSVEKDKDKKTFGGRSYRAKKHDKSWEDVY